MIVKSILKEEILTQGEVKDILDQIRLKRSGEVEEMGYELRRSIRHSEIFASIPSQDSRKMVDILLQREKMTPEIAVKIADLKPANRDELRAIYAKERFNLTEEDLDGILDIVLMG